MSRLLLCFTFGEALALMYLQLFIYIPEPFLLHIVLYFIAPVLLTLHITLVLHTALHINPVISLHPVSFTIALFCEEACDLFNSMIKNVFKKKYSVF